jgi:hypothetical protein
MRHIRDFIELASILLTAPESFIVSVRRVEWQRYAPVCSLLASISIATGSFYLRSSYSLSFLLFIPLVAGLIFLFYRFYSHLLSARFLQHLLDLQKEGSANTAVPISRLLEASFLPGLFVLPVCITAKEFSWPGLLLIPGILSILFWILYIQYAGIRYIMEISGRSMIRLLFQNHLMLAMFPFLAIYTGMLLLIMMMGIL